MKKFALSAFVLAGIFLLFGCSGLTDGKASDTDSESTAQATVPNDGKAYLCVTNARMGNSARTALPSFTDSTVADFAYTLKGTVSGGTQETLGKYESLADLQQAAIAVGTGTWSFVLTAEKDGTVFKGELTNQEITVGANALSFALSWDDTALSGKGETVKSFL